MLTYKEKVLRTLFNKLEETSTLTTKTAIANEYITTQEYMLFIEDMKGEKLYYQPDHWNSTSTDEEKLEEPISGIRSEDAIKFCEWVSSLNFNKGTKYRLPTLEEDNKFPISIGLYGSWCQNNASNFINASEQTISFLSVELVRLSKIKFENELVRCITQDINTTFQRLMSMSFENITFDKTYPLLGITNSIEAVLGSFYTQAENFIVTSLYDIQDICRAYFCAKMRDIDVNIAYEHNHISLFNPLRVEMSGYREIIRAFRYRDFTNAKLMITELRTCTNPADLAWSVLLDSLLSIAQAEEIVEVRRAYRQYCANLALFAYMGYSQKANNNQTPTLSNSIYKKNLLDRIKVKSKSPVDYQQTTSVSDFALQKQILADIYMDNQIMMAREDGRLPAWETIRLVKEKI